MPKNTDLIGLSSYAEGGGELHVIIETPKGSRNKFDYDEEHGLFKLGGVLPAGAVFPFDFGFIPSTLGGDGDPIEHFFVSYNEIKGKKFEPLGRFGPIKAARLIEEAAQSFRQKNGNKSTRKTRSSKKTRR